MMACRHLIVAQLLHLEAENPSKEISMYINSPGGVVTSGLSIYDTMQYIRPKVSTLVMGMAASMGSFAVGPVRRACGSRCPMPQIMVHQPSGGFQGQATDILIHAEHTMKLREADVRALCQAHRPDDEKRRKGAGTGPFMTPEEALEWGHIDEIVESRGKLEDDKKQAGFCANLCRNCVGTVHFAHCARLWLF